MTRLSEWSRHWRSWLVTLACLGFPGCNGCACLTCTVPAVHFRDGGPPSRDVGPPDVGRDAGPPGPTDICGNGLDDDGNGEVDEHCVCIGGQRQPCYGGPPASARVGICDVGAMVCVSISGFGTWDDCIGWQPPTHELCDPPGLDDDCDGAVDETCIAPGTDATQGCFPGTDAERGVGACAPGMQTGDGIVLAPDGSSATGWGECVGAVGPTGETCNGIDDDCDGTVDDTGPEICDLADDDCDMRIDEDTACDTTRAYWTPFWSPTPPGVLPPYASLHRLAHDLPVPGTPCASGGLRFETSRGVLACVPPPPDCAYGTRPEFLGGGWVCSECGVVIQLGATHFERRCEAWPTIACEGPYELSIHDSTWHCATGCNPFSPASFIDGRKICLVP